MVAQVNGNCLRLEGVYCNDVKERTYGSMSGPQRCTDIRAVGCCVQGSHSEDLDEGGKMDAQTDRLVRRVMAVVPSRDTYMGMINL